MIKVNNRKLAEGFFRGVGAADPEAALRALDKLDKVGAEQVARLLVSEAGIDSEAAALCLRLAQISGGDETVAERVRDLGVQHPLLDQGLDELSAVVGAANAAPARCVDR